MRSTLLAILQQSATPCTGNRRRKPPARDNAPPSPTVAPSLQRAVLQAAEDMREACRGLVALLAELRDQLQAELQEGGHGEGQEAEEEGAAASSVGLYGQEDVACELPLPGEKPVCSGDDMGVEGDWGAEEGGKGPGQGGALLPLGPRLRARVQGMGVAPWLVPPMLSPRTTVG